MNKQEFLKRASAKNMKQMRGHDAPSYEWDVYLDNKKICNCWDDSFGGELQITDYKGQSIENIYNKIDKESLWDKEYKWTTSLELLMNEIHSIGLFKKDEKKGVIVGKNNNYNIIGFNTSIPTTFKKWNDSKKAYQEIIDKAIKEGKEILNVEYLKTWGLNI
tara:strand:+ start:1766 stop:2251 length:486 start_codon:yes stop_codon:yes gene_type:complete